MGGGRGRSNQGVGRVWRGISTLKGSPLRHALLQPPELEISHVMVQDVTSHITQLHDPQQQQGPLALQDHR